MLQFLVGVALGAWATAWYKRAAGDENLEHRMAEIQARVNTLVGEARRVVDDVRKGVEDQFPGEEIPVEEETPTKEEPGPAANT